MSVQRRAACRQRSSRRSAAVCMPASRRSSRRMSSERCGWPCSSAISASSISRGTARLGDLRVGAGEQRLCRIEIADVDRSARADNRVESAGTRYRQRFQRRAAVPCRNVLRAARRPRSPAPNGPAPASGAGATRAPSRGKPNGADDQADRSIQRGEADDGDQQQQVERKLDPIRRRDQTAHSPRSA